METGKSAKINLGCSVITVSSHVPTEATASPETLAMIKQILIGIPAAKHDEGKIGKRKSYNKNRNRTRWSNLDRSRTR